MIKKLLAFAYCVVPFGATAASITIDPVNGGQGSDFPGGLSVPGTYDWALVLSGSGLTLGSGGLSADSLYVGSESTSISNGQVLIMANNDVRPDYTIRSDGDINISNVLNIAADHSLGIAAQTPGGKIEQVSLGAITATGGLFMQDIDALATKNITTEGLLDITADSMATDGTIFLRASATTENPITAIIDIANEFSVTGNFMTDGGGVTQVSAGSLDVGGTVQNEAGSVTIASNGTIDVGGSFENSGEYMRVTGTDMTVDGTMKNDYNGGTMQLGLTSLTINGGSGNDASFVNSGNLEIMVTGTTYLENGFDLSGMTEDNTFKLHTGQLVWGEDITADGLLQVFENNELASFELVVNNGGIAAGNIINGSDNENAHMILGAGSDGITASTLQNYGAEMNIYTLEGSAGNITIGETAPGVTSIFGAADTTTSVIAAGDLTANGAVSNAGTMTLNGLHINLTGVANSGEKLRIAAQTGEEETAGTIYLSGGVANSAGATEIDARQINIEGVVATTGGTTTIHGSDYQRGGVQIGGISAAGGVTNIDALYHEIDITNDLLVTNGALNIGPNTYELKVGHDVDGGVPVGSVQISGDVTFSGNTLSESDSGDVNIANSGVNRFVLTAFGGIDITGNVTAIDGEAYRTGSFVADIINIGGDVEVSNKGNIAFGDEDSTNLTVVGDVTANNGGTVEIYSDATSLNSLSGNGKFIMHGDSVTATSGDIDIENGIWYDGSDPTSGMIINGTKDFTLRTNNQDISIGGGISMANVLEVVTEGGDPEPQETTLNIISAADANISGTVDVAGTVEGSDDNVSTIASTLNVTAANGTATFSNGTMSASNGGVINVVANEIETAGITVGANSAVSLGNADTESVTTNALVSNAGTLDIAAGEITMTALKATNGTATVTATGDLAVESVDVSGGLVALSGDSITSNSMTLSGGSTELSSADINAGDIIVSSGNLNQGGNVGTLILTNSGTLDATNLRVTNGKFVVSGGDVTYTVGGTAQFANGIEGVDGTAVVNANEIRVGGTVTNAANVTLNSQNDLSLGVVENTGTLNLSAKEGDGNITGTSITNSNNGKMDIAAKNLSLTGAFTTPGVLYQNYAGSLPSKAVNISAPNHTLTTSNLIVGGINQSGSSSMTIKTSDVTINGDITAKDLRIQANPLTDNDWLNAYVSGNIFGGTKFVGLEHMYVGGNYTYDNDSMLHAIILPTPGFVDVDQALTYNYWATVSLEDDNTLGQITNASENAAPIVSVHGQFIYNVSDTGSDLTNAALVNPQIGITIFDMVDSGTAIWLLHSDSNDGLAELSDKIRNLNVNFCNADGTKCFQYFDSSVAGTSAAGQTSMNLPAYLTVRDIDEDGVTDSIYIVFDSRFGGPVQVFKIQPIVARVDDHTKGEYDSAGALDDMIEGGLQDAKFNNRSPIEAIPVAFKGTNLETLANEIYGRMEQYVLDRDGTALARISRLVQPREIEQVAGSVALEEHTFFRDFEDHMLDEFIWNRHRSLEKAWLDVDYGLFYQNGSDGKHINGDRFSIVGGYDWQHSSTLILGFAGHISHMSADDTDVIDLTYKPGQRVDGQVDFDVADTDIGVGAYLMKILGVKTRLYGNAFLDLHLLDVSREQNFVSHIDGSGTAFSMITEWGFLHDWLNQYIVGNLYARGGYNFGFSVTEKAGGDEYMHLESDGYFILTPGYSLIAQKRFYPSSWFQIRPYLSAGVEYDVLGAPDYAKFKFGPAKRYTKYDIEINPLWANIGGGVELLSSSGFQVGLDYRYQYNENLQLHKIRVAGSYRF